MFDGLIVSLDDRVSSVVLNTSKSREIPVLLHLRVRVRLYVPSYASPVRG
jgi:hypothetical protein